MSCTRSATPPAAPDGVGALQPLELPRPASPTALDPGATDPAIEADLRELRSRTRCNDVSGCPAEARLRAAGAPAAVALLRLAQAAKPQAPWLPRVVLLLGALGDDEALAWVRGQAEREEDAVRAAALLALIERGALPRARAEAEAAMRPAAAVARSMLTARWFLARGGAAPAEADFAATMRELAPQLVAADSLRWAMRLCGRAEHPRCQPLYADIARHPAHLLRREVLRRIKEAPSRADIPALLLLVGDPSTNLARDADALLQTITGQRASDAAAWRALLASEAVTPSGAL